MRKYIIEYHFSEHFSTFDIENIILQLKKGNTRGIKIEPVKKDEIDPNYLAGFEWMQIAKLVIGSTALSGSLIGILNYINRAREIKNEQEKSKRYIDVMIKNSKEEIVYKGDISNIEIIRKFIDENHERLIS